MSDSPIDLLRKSAIELQSLLEQIVFVGGTTTALYLDSGNMDQLRATYDVDGVVDVTRAAYQKLQAELRLLGFQHDQTTTYRMFKNDLVVDLMPIDPNVLGFTNRWYRKGVENAETIDLGGGLAVRTFAFPYFLASKLEAFKDRGKGDYYGSKDMDDIITVLGGRRTFLTEIEKAESEVRSFIVEQLSHHSKSSDFGQAILGHLPRGIDLERRAARLEADIESLLKI